MTTTTNLKSCFETFCAAFQAVETIRPKNLGDDKADIERR